MEIPGFGLHLAAALLTWRRGLEKRFRFNPSQPVPAAELRRLQIELKKPLEDYRKEISCILQEAQALERSLASITQRSSSHDAALAAQIAAIVQAEADLKAVKLAG